MTRPPPPTIAQLGELRLVRVLRQVLDRPAADLVVPNGDDALVWRPAGDVVATVDSVVAGIDWLPDRTPPEAIGHRAAAVNLSDLAAMGAEPRHLLLAMETPGDLSSDVVVRAARGLAMLAAQHGCAVAGGDVGLSPGPLRLTVTALGQLQGPALTRDRARPGDAVWLIGSVGRAALGLHLLQHLDRTQPVPAWAQPFVDAHLWPKPQVQAGRALQALAAAGQRIACIDVSDGLALDAGRVAEASRVGMTLEFATPPWPAESLQWCVQHGLRPADLCASGGDDYALLACAEPAADLSALGAERIGKVTVGPAGKVFVVVGGEVGGGAGWLHGSSAP